MGGKMPLYEYACPSCEVKFELIRPMSQATEASECPSCQHDAERILSNFACFTVDDSGLSAPLGGSPCASCGADSCDTCDM